jgi:hypothetical protein
MNMPEIDIRERISRSCAKWQAIIIKHIIRLILKNTHFVIMSKVT